MQERVYAFTGLLLVVATSIVFGMVLGGRLSAPEVALAAPRSSGFDLAPPAGRSGGGFADIAQAALPAVVSVTSKRRVEQSDGTNPFRDDPFFHQWFGEPDEDRGEPGPRVGAGSGFLISPDGYILTNNHVVEEFEKVEVRMQDRRTFAAEVVGTDPSIDLALLKIDPKGDRLPTLPLGDSEAVRVGEWVLAIGNPLDFDSTVTVGVVSGKNRQLLSLPTDSGVASFIQTDAAINFGNSGGPLLDAAGNVIGINTAIRRANFAEGIGFALPINTARDAMEQLRETGRVRRGYLGISMNQSAIDAAAAEYYGLPDPAGVIVSDVTRGGPAERAGIRPGDIVREVDGQKVRDNLDLISKIASRRPGEEVRLELFRDGESVRVRPVLADRQEGLDDQLGVRPPEETPAEPAEPQQAEALGMTVENPTSDRLERLGLEGEAGVLVTRVEFGSEAADRGVLAEMLVTALNDLPVPDVATWERVLSELEPGAPVKIDVLVPGRDGPQPRYYFLRKPEN